MNAQKVFGPGLDERGATMVLVALCIVALLGATALAIDVGMLLTARTEAQRSADAGAHGGALEWLLSGGDQADTRTAAQQVASTNLVIGIPPDVADGDVEFLTDPERVRVTVWRAEDRGNPVATYFARVLGVNAVDVSAVAAAAISEACGAGCPLPLALIDRWDDNDGDQQWDPEIDTYIPFPEPNWTGYDTTDAGLLVEIKGDGTPEEGPAFCQDTETYEPCAAFGDASWDCWWLEDHPGDGGGGGVDELEPRILSCVIEGMEIGDTIWSASGAGEKQSLVDAFKWLVDNEPDVTWDETDKCPKRDGEDTCLVNCLRCRSIPLVDPYTIEPDGGANTKAVIASWSGLFIEKVSCSPTQPHGAEPRGQWNVYARLMKSVGTGNCGRPGSLMKAVQIVE